MIEAGAPVSHACRIGIDEAGRGCLAGPVVAAAVLFASSFDFAAELPGLDDSKRLQPAKRGELADLIVQKATAYGVGFSRQGEIDAVNILNATFRAMSRAVLALAGSLEKAENARPVVLPPLVIDGNKVIPQEQWRACARDPEAERRVWEEYFPAPPGDFPAVVPALPMQCAVVDGDALIPTVSAASVLAKTVRDGIMTRLDALYPGYGFARHMGYGTKEHLRALAEKGPCRLHRATFRGVKPRAATAVVLKLP
ncbi:MAG: ribonuclease HII [Desulfovibrio sp.]|nr:ribonuclease HII [Desulfovibrio sp.]